MTTLPPKRYLPRPTVINYYFEINQEKYVSLKLTIKAVPIVNKNSSSSTSVHVSISIIIFK